MATARREFRFDGGATWLNLIATRGRTFGAHPVERLDSPTALDAWLAASGLTPFGASTPDDLTAAHRLRDALRDLALAATEGRAPDPLATDAVAAAMAGPTGGGSTTGGSTTAPAEGPAAPRLDGAAWTLAGLPDARGALALVAASALVTLGPDRAHLTSCAEHDCRWVFLDPSGRRRWCPEPACASRGRVRAYRERRAAPVEAEPDESVRP